MPRNPYPAVEGSKNTLEIYGSTSGAPQFKAKDFFDDSFIRELDNNSYIDGLYK